MLSNDEAVKDVLKTIMDYIKDNSGKMIINVSTQPPPETSRHLTPSAKKIESTSSMRLSLEVSNLPCMNISNSRATVADFKINEIYL
jgi:hypothetical protein